MRRLMGMKVSDVLTIQQQEKRADALKTWYDQELERARSLYPQAFSTTVEASAEHRGEEGIADR